MTAPAPTDTTSINPADLTAMRLIADGLTVRQVARRLGVSQSAICMRLFRMRDLIGAKTNAHAVAILTRSGQLDVTEVAR